jgi:cobalt-zinc-cadmium efflux system membrane fusion protein
MTGLLVSGCVVLALGCGDRGGTATPPIASAPSSPDSPRVLTLPPKLVEEGRVELSAVEKRPFADELMVTGQIVAPPHGKAEIGALLTARIRKIFVEEGAVIKKGQLLATLVAPDAARISGELAAARARRARAETVLAQEQKLAEQRATSERAISEAQSDAASARADEQAAQVMLSSYNVSGAELTLRSPLDGVLAESQARLGVQVEPDTILFRIIDPKQLAVRADVPESMAERIPLGTQAHFRVSSSSRRCTAEVVASTRSVDPIKRTVGYRLRPTEDCGGLLEGGFADVTIPLKPQDLPKNVDAGVGEPDVVVVPRSAIVELDGVATAFVALETPGQYRLTPLTIKRHGEYHSVVEQGLTGTERVVSKGALLLKGEWMKSRLE